MHVWLEGTNHSEIQVLFQFEQQRCTGASCRGRLWLFRHVKVNVVTVGSSRRCAL